MGGFGGFFWRRIFLIEIVFVFRFIIRLGKIFLWAADFFDFFMNEILMRRVDSFIAYGVPIFFTRMAQPYHGMGAETTVHMTLSRLSLYTFIRF